MDDDDDDDYDPQGTLSSASVMAQRSGSNLAFGAARPPSGYLDPNEGPAASGNAPFDPYVGYGYHSMNRATASGYMPARTTSPPPPPGAGPAPLPGSPATSFARQNSTSGSAEGAGQHSRTYSYSSYEPLLAAAGLSNDTSAPGPSGRTPPSTPALSGGVIVSTRGPTPPPRSPMRPRANSGLSSKRSRSRGGSSASLPRTDEANGAAAGTMVGKTDARLDPAMSTRLKRMNTSASEGGGLRDDQDYSRPVLGVRGLYFH